MKEAVIINKLTKEYRLGVIGSGTLKEDLQNFTNRLLKRNEEQEKEKNSTKESGQKTFRALSGVNLTVKPGERIGLIGHNGAGKSTLLKLLSRITMPTSGEIILNGRVSSMLEVGTGFHADLTGRENVFMNGAINGMKKKEIAAKFDEIVEFAEIGKFIDTPVKRYSSGMYVKLAFSVAAHLDSDIVLMDEVLAVGDMKFQEKCLLKMKQMAQEEGRTIIYVSHNMNTVKQLCNRAVVLEAGQVIYDGDVDGGIQKYYGLSGDNTLETVFTDAHRGFRKNIGRVNREDVLLHDIRILDKQTALYKDSEALHFELTFDIKKPVNNVLLRIDIRNSRGDLVATSICDGDLFFTRKGQIKEDFELPLKGLTPGSYNVAINLTEFNSVGTEIFIDAVHPAATFTIVSDRKEKIEWPEYWGQVRLPDIVEG